MAVARARAVVTFVMATDTKASGNAIRNTVTGTIFLHMGDVFLIIMRMENPMRVCAHQVCMNSDPPFLGR